MNSSSMSPRSFEVLRHLARELVALSPSERQALVRLFLEEVASASMQALAEAGAALPVREQALGAMLVEDFLASLGLCEPLNAHLDGDAESCGPRAVTAHDAERPAAPVLAVVGSVRRG